MRELQTAEIGERRGNFLSNFTPRFRADFVGLVLTPKISIGNVERYMLCCRSLPIRVGGPLYLDSVSVHSSTRTGAKHDCEPFSAAVKSPDAKETYSWLSLA